MPRKKRVKKEDVNTEAWLATYSDTITLVLTFFILLYSMSTVDAEKLEGISSALQGQLTGEGVMGSGTSDKTGDKEPPIIDEITKEEIPKEEMSKEEIAQKVKEKEIKEKIKATIQEAKLGDSIKIREDDRGIVLEMNENILFDLGSGDLKRNSLPVLNDLASLLSVMSNHIIIEGHTDNIPIKSSRYGSNWELSTQRAVSVVRFFVEQKGMNPDKFSASGYGEYRPLADNTTPENRAKNRRVDIVITTE